jgi:hypothetical protein
MKHDAYCLAVGNSEGELKRVENAPWNGRFDCAMELANGATGDCAWMEGARSRKTVTDITMAMPSWRYRPRPSGRQFQKKEKKKKTHTNILAIVLIQYALI